MSQIIAMDFLDFSHDPLLVAFATIIAIVAGFTGLTLTRNLSQKSDAQRKISIALAAIALGGGIWSMHFVAMLGLHLPVLFYYDAAITLASALIAILLVGVALVLLHFFERSLPIILSAGAVVGVGILAMHYVGMAGLELCRAVYTLPGVLLSSIVAIALCMLAIWVAYSYRKDRNIVFATFCFAAAVASVHFLAMQGTNFIATEGAGEFGPKIGNDVMAIGVILFSFLIFGTCLWVSTAYLHGKTSTKAKEAAFAPMGGFLQIPCEQEGRKVFLSSNDVAFVRADGHYTQVYTAKDRLFCVWPITEAINRLVPLGFTQTHRSYLVNLRHVSRFERTKDTGRCIFESEDLPPVPVSRSKLSGIQRTLSEIV